MKKSRLLITLLCLTVAAVGFAQDSYREAIKEFNLLTGADEQLTKIYTNVNNLLFKATDDVDLDELTATFVKENMDQIVDMIEPLMREHNVTESDLREVCALLSTPEGRSYTAHQNELREAFPKVFMELFFDPAMADRMVSLEETGTAENLPVDPKIDSAYAAKFFQLYEASNFMDRYKERLSSMGMDDIAGNKALLNWLSENVLTVMLNTSYGLVTPEDLDFGIKMLSSNESCRKTLDASQMNEESLRSAGVEMMEKYEAWMKAHGAQSRDKDEIFKQMMEIYKGNFPE